MGRPDTVIEFRPLWPFKHGFIKTDPAGIAKRCKNAARIAQHIFSIDDGWRCPKLLGHGVEYLGLLGEANIAQCDVSPFPGVAGENAFR